MSHVNQLLPAAAWARAVCQSPRVSLGSGEPGRGGSGRVCRECAGGRISSGVEARVIGRSSSPSDGQTSPHDAQNTGGASWGSLKMRRHWSRVGGRGHGWASVVAGVGRGAGGEVVFIVVRSCTALDFRRLTG